MMIAHPPESSVRDHPLALNFQHFLIHDDEPPAVGLPTPTDESCQYAYRSILGSGTFGTTFRAEHRVRRGQYVAVKVLDKGRLSAEELEQFEYDAADEDADESQLRHTHARRARQVADRERDAMYQIGSHVAFPTLYHALESKKHLLLFMELCEGGNLNDLLARHRLYDVDGNMAMARAQAAGAAAGTTNRYSGMTIVRSHEHSSEVAAMDPATAAVERSAHVREPLTTNAIEFIFIQILIALNHLHRQNMAHRDLKSLNVLLTGSGLVRVADFSFTARATAHHTACGTPYAMAPEQWGSSATGYTHKVDMWAAGVLLYEMMALRRPFAGTTAEAIQEAVTRRKIIPLNDFHHVMKVACYPKELRELVDVLVTRQVDKRPEAERLLQHPYLRKVLNRFMLHLSKALPAEYREYEQALCAAGLWSSSETPQTDRTPTSATASANPPSNA